MHVCECWDTMNGTESVRKYKPTTTPTYYIVNWDRLKTHLPKNDERKRIFRSIFRYLKDVIKQKPSEQLNEIEWIEGKKGGKT